jgi:protein-disulfide isomerase
MKKFQQYILPLAIVIAGVLVSGTIYMSQNKSGASEKGKSVADIAQDALRPKIDVAAVTSADHIMGSINAKVKLIVYTDPECPFCKIFHNTTKALYEQQKAKGDLAIVYRMFPLESLHPKAPKISEAFECAAEIGGNDSFWKYADQVFDYKPSGNDFDLNKLYEFAGVINVDSAKFKTCLDSGKYAAKISEGIVAGSKAGGQGTPYSVVSVKGQFIPLVDANGNGYGALPLPAISQIISELSKI